MLVINESIYIHINIYIYNARNALRCKQNDYMGFGSHVACNFMVTTQQHSLSRRLCRNSIVSDILAIDINTIMSTDAEHTLKFKVVLIVEAN